MAEVDADIRSKLLSHVRRVCPRWMTDDVDDLVQMAAMRLMRTTSTAEWSGAFLSRVAYSAVIDEIRRRKRRNEVGGTPSMFDRVEDVTALTPENQAHSAELAEALLECLETLVPARKRAVTLYLQGHTVPEIATLLDWTRKKVSNAVYRGLPDLRAALEARGIRPS